MIKRRYELIYITKDDKTHMGKYWTRWGAKRISSVISPMLRDIDDTSLMVLLDNKTKKEQILSAVFPNAKEAYEFTG